MKAYSLALVLVRATALLGLLDRGFSALYVFGSIFVQSTSSGDSFLMTGLSAAIGPSIYAFVWLAVLLMSPKIASFISSSGSDVKDSDPYSILTTGIRLIGLWYLVLYLTVIPSFIFGGGLTPFASLVAHIRTIQEAYLGAIIGILLLLFAPQLTRLFMRQDKNLHVRELLNQQLDQNN